jgi:glucosamine--fructose-6-phosphate aminotransferase (isomerizing)
VLGERFEAEIREQPRRWRAVAQAGAAAQLAAAIDGPALFIGSGSSLFVGELAASAWQRNGREAAALAASEVRAGCATHAACTIAISQSGRSADVLAALDRLAPERLIAVTNDLASPLAQRASVVVDIGAGVERAVPASKSVTCSAALVLWSAALAGGTPDGGRHARALTALADDVDAWLGDAGAGITRALKYAEGSSTWIIAGTGSGIPAASEIALKLREAAYQPALGVAAGEFLHGSTAMLDARTTLLGLGGGDADGGAVARLFAATQTSGAPQLSLGAAIGTDVFAGPPAQGPFAPLAWIVAGQMLALALGRSRGIDSDAPRGLRKFIDA